MSNIVKNIRKGDEWEVGGELHVKAGGKFVVDGDIEGVNEVPATGTTGHYLKKTADGCEFATLPDATTSAKGVVKQCALVADAAGDAPTAAEFNALLAALKTAGIMANA